MATVYKYSDDKVLEIKNEKEETIANSMSEFIVQERELDEDYLSFFLESVEILFDKHDDTKSIHDSVLHYVTAAYVSFFTSKDNSDGVTDRALKIFEKSLFKTLEGLGSNLLELTKKSIIENANNLLKNNINGGSMFKTTKEAKAFTAHLDALATEIESLSDVSTEMKQHLAFRLDRLSDLIENSAAKEASMDKEANGVGKGSWLYDADEGKYMGTFGGTGTLEGDADEAKYMKQFKDDDHKEVLERKENMDIKEDGSKKKQPSDNYNEAEVARKLKAYVRSAIEKSQK